MAEVPPGDAGVRHRLHHQRRLTVTDLTAGEIAAYDAPFPDDSYKAGARIFPSLVPTRPDDPGRRRQPRRVGGARARGTSRSSSASATATRSPRGGDAPFPAKVPGAAGQPHVTIERRRPLLPGGRRRTARPASLHRRHRPMTDWIDLTRRAGFVSHRLIGWIYWDPVAIENYAALGPDGSPTTSPPAARPSPMPATTASSPRSTRSSPPSSRSASTSAASARRSTRPRQARDAGVVAGLREYVPEICDELASMAEPLWAAAERIAGRRPGAVRARAATGPAPTIRCCRRGWRSTASGSGAATRTGRS